MDALSKIATKYPACDKHGHHDYTPIYNSYFERMRGDNFTMIELGIGGYEFPDRGGDSLRMWAEYFPKATIVGVDIYPKILTMPKNVAMYQAGQTDYDAIEKIVAKHGAPSIIIDDASHNSQLTIKSFVRLFPLLKSGGWYVVEDTHTSYWNSEEYGGTNNLHGGEVSSSMNYFKIVADILNEDAISSCDLPLIYPEDIATIHFYKSLIFIQKK